MKRILWFRRDLRAEDNALLGLGGEVFPVFIFERQLLDPLPPEDRRVSFLFEAVLGLKASLQRRGLDLALFYGEPEAVFDALMQLQPDEVCASGEYDAYARERDRRVSQRLPFRFLHDTYLFAPDEVCKADGSPYLRFTPFYRNASARLGAERYREIPRGRLRLLPFDYRGISQVAEGGTVRLEATPEALGFRAVHHGVPPAEALLARFAPLLEHYADAREFPAAEATSGLGPHLRFGTLGVRALMRWLAARREEGRATEPFLRQLLFRDFYAGLLYRFPELARQNYRYGFSGIEDEDRFEAFRSARTGVPIVDAGVSQLLATGRMHNRVRMLCASFFTKELLLPWQWGEAFFARHLLDYDAATNILSWQWSAGTGIDPQPYFRIFNPYAQSAKFDAAGRYIRRWLPQLAPVPAGCLHDEGWLQAHDIDGYPRPILQRREAVRRAQERFREQR